MLGLPSPDIPPPLLDAAEATPDAPPSHTSRDASWIEPETGSGDVGRLQGIAQLATRRDAELGKQVVEVRADRAVGDVQLLADLLVRKALGGKLRDLQLLRGQLRPSLRNPSTSGLAGRAELAERPFGVGLLSEGVEDLGSFAEGGTRIRGSSLNAAQPHAVREQRARRVGLPALGGGDGHMKELLCFVVLAEDGSRVGQLDLEVRRRRVDRNLPPFVQIAAHEVEIAVAAHGSVDEIGERMAAQERV